MADHLKCIFCIFQHVVVVQYTKQSFYWIPHPRKYVCRYQDIYPNLTSAGDIVNLAIVYFMEDGGRKWIPRSCGPRGEILTCIIIS